MKIIRTYLASGFQLLLFVIAYVPSQFMRKMFLRLSGARIAEDVRLYHGFKVRSPWNLVIERGSVIGNGAILDARAGLRIGKNVNFSADVAIWTVQHIPQSPTFASKSAAVVVEDNAWLSFRAVVLPGVTISQGAVVAACAVVTKNVSPYSIVAGVPACTIGERTRALTYDLGSDGYYRFI